MCTDPFSFSSHCDIITTTTTTTTAAAALILANVTFRKREFRIFIGMFAMGEALENVTVYLISPKNPV